MTKEEREKYFKSLIAPPAVKKKRTCLKCGRSFLSESSGHRICCFCVEKNEVFAKRAEETYL
jgi:hypothetical protein